MSEPDLAALRRDYLIGGLDEADLLPDPVAMFRRWMHDAVTAGLHEPNAMVVATATPAGVPSVRTVLLKGLDERGFVFFTNYTSRKGAELAANPACALLFPWHELERQVRVEGPAARLSDAENAAYFATRPRGSKIGAWASPQSQPVPDRAALDQRYAEVAGQFADVEVPLPPHWGGFRVAPETVEFWQGRSGRMHDRLRYRRTPLAGAAPGGAAVSIGSWAVDRLAP